MAVNPLYRNEYYFFSNMYDDSLITEFYRKISTESYERSKLYQQNMLGRKRFSENSAIFYKSTLGELKIDDIYNESVGIPNGSRTLNIHHTILPVHNKKKFLSTYGLRNQKIPITDFLKRVDIFDNSITLQIGKYRIMNAYLIQNLDRSITLAIPNSTSGITLEHFNKVFEEYHSDEPVWIFSDEITQTYYTDTSFAAAVSSTPINGYYDVKIPKTAVLNNISSPVNHTQYNSWDCLITFKSNSHGRKLLVACSCTLKSVNSDYLVFSVSEEFLNMIKTGGVNFNIYFINRPNRKHMLIYPYNANTSPILNLDYTYNPSGNINIEIFEISTSTMCKGRKLYDPQITQVYFPNIFDFSELNVNKSDLIIEVTEYDPSYTNQIMNNSISPLINSLGFELYAEYVANGHDKSLNGISMGLKDYHPTYYPVYYSEYFESEYSGNLRGYILDNISKTIESDPYLAASYYSWMLNRNKKVTTLNGTPKTLCFGTGKSGEFSGSNEIVTDTSIASAISDDIQYFTEPHSYITYYSSMEKCPSMVYVNGKYVRPTCTRFYRGINYLFFPVSLINTEMSRYSSDEEIIAASPITVDMYPSTHTSIHEAPKDVIIIESATEVIKLFDHIENPKFSLDELVLYDNSTGEYLGSLMDIFNVNLVVTEYKINNPGINDSILVSKGEMDHYLLTVLEEIYATMDAIPIVIDSATTDLNVNEFINEMISSGIITEDDKRAFTHKLLNFNDIELTPKSENFIGMNIAVYTKEFKKEYIVNSNTGTYDSDNNITSYTLSNINIDPDMSRYFIYIGGHLEMNATLTKLDNVFGGSLLLTLLGDHTSSNEEINIVHMPIGYHRENFSVTSRVFYMKEAVKSEIETNLLWPDSENDGVILQIKSGRIYNSFAFENAMNMKFSANGLRLPSGSKSTNRLYAQYYDSERASVNNLKNGDSGYVFFIDVDQPIIDIAKQNPYSESYDESFAKNPLDVLTIIE